MEEWYRNRYNEALSQARFYYGNCPTEPEKKKLETIFPELAESEDEKIRKDIIGGLMWQRDNLKSEGPHDNSLILPGFCFTVGKHLAYLEKQKENPKTADSIPSDCVPDAKCEDRWHKVSDSLPDNPREVLCKDEGGNYFIGRFYVAEGWEISNYDGEDKPHYLNPPVSKWIDFPSEKQKEQKEIPLMDGNADLYFDEWNQQKQNPTKRQCFEEGMKYAQMLQKEQKPVQSEDEREYVKTLKGLVSDFIRDCGEGIDDVGYYQHICDWLDGRHIEQKSVDLPAGFYVTLDGKKYYAKEMRCNGMTVKVVEPKPAEWKDEYREEDIQTRFAFYTYKDDPSTLYLSNVFVEEASRNHGFGTRILKAAEKAAEAVGATTISLKVKQDSPANAWYRKNGYGYVCFEDGYDWLEKNLEYMKPKKEVEWSEEDENALKYIHELISFGYTEKFFDAQTATDMREWLNTRLKSLRPQPKQERQIKEGDKVSIHCRKDRKEYIITKFDGKVGEVIHVWDAKRNPWGHIGVRLDNGCNNGFYEDELEILDEPSWKPSEEQMEAFRSYIKDFQEKAEAAVGGWNNFDVMIRLFEQLKKLCNQ